MANYCGEHHYYVADVAVVEAEGKVVVIIVCTSCGDSKALSHKVTDKPGSGMITVSKQPTKGEFK